jgi:hypothetical protein
LAVAGRHATEVAVRVENRQQGEPNTRVVRGCGDARGEFTEVGVGRPVAIMMEIMEFTDAREARLQHLRKCKRADRLEILGT